MCLIVLLAQTTRSEQNTPHEQGTWERKSRKQTALLGFPLHPPCDTTGNTDFKKQSPGSSLQMSADRPNTSL
ncbi:uncharacterized protein CTRU02_203555 [Colletotrichum truncatum]|uniref:Uncharacterized protein n=1 Tax=Colletotrichum truncatum TaxID=5467 RepID=A0ACC3Z9M2_COLTU|nr:uncharacterized protein CTRU02_05940 [Colletotrichum truncatum]KAF6793685.1 hypothetical protein CTRU02_05940 [Colletotrichum truncatum]